MYQRLQEEGSNLTREEKLYLAKSSFQSSGDEYAYKQNKQPFMKSSELSATVKVGKPSFWLLRFLTACMIFMILVFAFQTKFSYYGFNQEYVQNCLNSQQQVKQLEKKMISIYHYMKERGTP